MAGLSWMLQLSLEYRQLNMVYKNKKTGAVIHTECECLGEWELVKETKETKVKEEPKENKKKEK